MKIAILLLALVAFPALSYTVETCLDEGECELV